MSETYRLMGPDGASFQSTTPGQLGGNSNAKIYGRLECTAANGALAKGYAARRVFFADEAAAIAAGYRPCGRCLRERYELWKSGGGPGPVDYLRLQTPQ